MKWLRLESQRYPLRQGETTIGRSPYCSIQLTSQQASREHAAIVVRGEDTTLSDLGSRNGTYLNGKRIHAPTALGVNDRITVGGLDLVVFEQRSISDDSSRTQEQVIVRSAVGVEESTIDLDFKADSNGPQPPES